MSIYINKLENVIFVYFHSINTENKYLKILKSLVWVVLRPGSCLWARSLRPLLKNKPFFFKSEETLIF